TNGTTGDSMASMKTKAVVALGALDIARQLAKAFAARQEAERDAARFGAGSIGSLGSRFGAGLGARFSDIFSGGLGAEIRDDAQRLTHHVRDRLPDEFVWGMPPWRSKPEPHVRLLRWLPIIGAIVASAAAVAISARRISRHDADLDAPAIATDSRLVGAVQAGGRAVDAGVTKLVDGGSGMAIGGATAIAAGTSAAKTAAVTAAKHQVDERIVKPAKRKAILFGTLAFVGVTIYLVLIVGVAQYVVDKL
ncbi:MAG: hypothetical protein JWN41_1359, partial [Thermoleophilia bacterium]|nr:hypothetical protein [Thermoleophilia bacterium]